MQRDRPTLTFQVGRRLRLNWPFTEANAGKAAEAQTRRQCDFIRRSSLNH